MMKITTEMSGAARTAAFSILICCVAYTSVIWTIGRLGVPDTASGSLVKDESGRWVGSRQIAQRFTQDRYFHSRPSHAGDGYDAMSAGGSNLSPTSPELRKRAATVIAATDASADNPIPADLVTASGSGLDPHITLAAAKFQVPRVAKARGLSESELLKMIGARVEYPGGIMRHEPIVNVLMLNLALDGMD